jgi:predicted transcriptional regulator
MVNSVYRKIKELCAMGLNPRGPVPINTLVHHLNISPARISMVLGELIEQRLIIYQGPQKQLVKLTLLGANVTR